MLNQSDQTAAVIKIDALALAPGLYFLSLKRNGKVITQQLLRE
jgi:hypothetical protein